ncbi:hypothetical protein DOY81_002045 [Sarcophaga bullata]|nr:hypothetical protein DOY81_002045 [Sarcophaga bullata]
MNNINPSRTELEEIKLQVGRVTDESLESTRRMLALVEESGEAGTRTLEALDEQRRQLNHVEEDMDNINNDMKSAEKALNNLKRCCNICSFPSNRVPKEDKCNMKPDIATNLEHNVIVNQPRLTNNDDIPNRNTSGTSANEYITRITKDAREDEMNSNLNQVNSMLGVLRNMAVDMNSELQSQNGQLDRIIRKADSNNIHLDQVNTSANDLLNNK